MRQTGDLDDSANIARSIVFRQESAGLQHDTDAVTQTASDAGDFDTMCQPVVRQVMFGKRVDLGFPAQPPECAGKHDSIVINVEIGTQGIDTLLCGRRNRRDNFAVFRTEALRGKQLGPSHCHWGNPVCG